MQVVPGKKCNYLGGIIDEYDYFNESIVYCGNCVYRNSAGAEHSKDSFHGGGTGEMDAEKIRLGMGIGLLVVGVVMALKQLQIGPLGLVGMETGIYGIKLIISVIVEFFVGAFMTIGVGAYAPTFALVSMMGMNVQSAFPIMMGGCAFLMTFGAGPEFIKSGRYDMIATLTNATFGSLGALIAYMFVKSVPLTILLWIVVAVVFYTAIMFIRDYAKSREPKKAAKSIPAKAE